MAGWKVLVVGSGAREHALAWKLGASPRVDRVFCAPGNGGTGAVAENVPVAANQTEALVDWVEAHRIDLVVVGPEEPLALGLADRLRERGVPVLGPGAAGARIEASKFWAKSLMGEAGVPTAAYATFTDREAAWRYVQDQPFPLVVKADGLAGGKGVVVAETLDQAREAIDDALERNVFGEGGQRLVIEEFLRGPEVSLLALVDGQRALPLVLSRDHKRAGEGDIGPMTGGMGAIAPAQAAGGLSARALGDRFIQPMVDVLRDHGVVYRGVLYAGLILTSDGPKVLEFNCRFGDPETQVVLPLLGEDLATLAYAAATDHLPSVDLTVEPGYRCGVVLTAGGYPGPYQSGVEIRGLSDVDSSALVFHGGTRLQDGVVVTAGGRVLTLVGCGDTLDAARAHAYVNAERIQFEGCSYRRDIGLRDIRVQPRI